MVGNNLLESTKREFAFFCSIVISNYTGESIMKNEIQKLLYRGGVFHSYRGYSYFEQAVLLVYESPDRILNMTKEVYEPIANQHNTNIKAVEKAIRTVRDVFMKNNGNDILKEIGYVSWNTRYPYPRELIEIFASYLTSIK